MLRWKGVPVFVSMICVLPLFAGIAIGSENDSRVPVADAPALIASTKDELLLFWDEKDLYVETATRYEKPISQVSENITVVTAKEIEDMNAHTVAEVLNRVTGVFIDSTWDFGAISFPFIQGAQHPSHPQRHVLVLFDGVAWNSLEEGAAETLTIPVEIIDRIEIVKGPASSVWGSSLGGVVNIITKDVGDATRPEGMVSASFGERDTHDYRADIAGKAGPVGYYLYAGRQDSNGLRYGRFFDNDSLYAKLNFSLSKDVKAGLTFGYSDPFGRPEELPSYDLKQTLGLRTRLVTANVEAALSRYFNLELSGYSFNQKLSSQSDFISTGARMLDIFDDEKTVGGSGKLILDSGIHSAVFGLDISHGKDHSTETGQINMDKTPTMDKWAVFLNDTLTLGKFSITPGVRHDHNNVTGAFTSPSLGAAYRLAERTILRASVARGFTVPPFSMTAFGGFWLDPNPELRPEKVWSYQGGIESGVTDYVWVKATAFFHDMKNSIERVWLAPVPPPNDKNMNKGDIKRQGVELEAETAPVFNVSVKAGLATVRTTTSPDDSAKDNYEYNLGVKYDDTKSFMAQIFGHYVWWELDRSLAAGYSSFVWQLDLRKKIYTVKQAVTEIFASAHNLFNASQYSNGEEQNPRRWVEAGLRLRF